MGSPTITAVSVYELQACIPESWDDAAILELAEDEHPAGTRAGWFIRADKGRVRCAAREGFVHVIVGV